MPDIEIKRGYEVLPDNNVRFGIRVINNSDFAISDVEVLLDYSESLFELSGNKVQKLGTIPPAVPRTAKFLLKPLGCIHKENIGATIIYKDHQWKKHTIEMIPKEVHCVCPFLKEKSITRAEFLRLSNSGYLEERGVNFEGITVNKLVEFISHTCKNRLYKVDEFPIENGRILYLAGDAVGEKSYYLLTAVVKESEGLTQVLLRANSDKNYGLNGFLNEILDNLRHLVVSASAREIGIIRKEQVINIIDSVVQRSSFSVSDGAPSVNIRDSVVQRAEIKADEEKKKCEEERLRKEREEQERREKEEKAQRGKEEEKRWRMEEEQRREKQEKYEAFLLKQKKEDGERKTREDRERKAEAERREREKAIQEEERQRRHREEATLLQKEKEYERGRIEQEKKSSGGKWFFAVILIFAVIALGWYDTQDSSIHATPSAAAVITSSADQNTITNSIGMDFVLIPAGEFDMGSPANDNDRSGAEVPVHHVKISNPFYMGKYEVTQKQWQEVMGNNPSNFKRDNLPVDNVPWNDAQDFIKKLNDKEGENKYRLPTEAEWEYAARAGTTTRYSFGDNESNLGDYAWYNANSGGRYHEVGQKKPNPWGLYDMHGNVREWVQDRYHENYDAAPTDGSLWESKGYLIWVNRGGDFINNARLCRSASRGGGDSTNGYGFRLLSVSAPKKTTLSVNSTAAVVTSSTNPKTNSISIEFVLIPAGEFNMGSPSNEVGRDDNEGPVHQVKISNAFYMGKYEVTQKQWRDVMGTSPSYFKGDNLPVEQVSWNDVQDFIKKINEKEGGSKYRLPTEAEWEYAARAGTTTRYSFGDDESMLGNYAWCDANAEINNHDVGQKKPNPWGLYDIHGNVWEWVQDSWHGDYTGAPKDGSSWESGSDRVLRGGGWAYYARPCHSAGRGYDLDGPGSGLGFRLLMEV